MYVALDTSVLVALLNPNDIWHSKAKVVVQALDVANITPINFDCVVAEAASVLARRLHEKGRDAEVLATLERLVLRIPYHLVTWILPEVPYFYNDVLGLMKSSSGELNFNDALIALSCREREISAIASFDTDFDEIGWLRRIETSDDVAHLE